MSSRNRTLSYSLAINEAFHQVMEQDQSVLLIGQGVKSPWYIGNTAQSLLDRFGTNRVIDTPVSENAITGVAIGASLVGMRAVVVHPRMDFMFYALDPIINEAANWCYMFGGKSSVPVVIWGIVNRGGEQAAQHSQALHTVFAHVPGLKVVAPSNPYDAKGLMVAAIRDNNPVVYVDDRWLYDIEGNVPETLYTIPIGKGIVRKIGEVVTLVSSSYLMVETLKASEYLEKDDISAEVIDLRTIKPIDTKLIIASVKKTGRLVVVDGSWKTCGYAAEISALITESIFKYLKAPIQRVTIPDCPAPASSELEKAYYPTHKDIISAARKTLNYIS